MMKQWMFRAHLGWRRGWIDAARAKRRRVHARERLRQLEQRKAWLRWRAGGTR